MRTKGINLENVKLNNRATVLKILNKSGAMSRKDLAAEIGLTAATLTLICNELLEEGILTELGELDEKEKRAGRKKILVNINHKYRNVVCISIESDGTYVSVTDLSGELLGQVQLETKKNIPPQQFLEEVAAAVKNILWEENIPKEKILAVGVTIPGKVDSINGIATSAYGIWDEPVEVAKLLNKALGFRIIVENNVKASAESELLYGGGKSTDELLLIKWGPGVGAAVIIDGQIYEGATGQAAEIGHVTVARNGLKCSCGKNGCLETVISKHAIKAAIEEAMNAGKLKDLKEWMASEDIEFKELSTKDLLSREDEELKDLIISKIDTMALAVENMACILNPSNIIVFGGMFDIPGFVEAFVECLKKYNPSMPDDYVLKSEFGERIYSIAPLSIVMNEMIFNQ